MSFSKFKIFNASAGSGKTFALTKYYLYLLLSSKNPNEFGHILAITFTNKAVGEMKERIISMLTNFSLFNLKDEPHPMLKALCNDLNLNASEIKSKSKIVLEHLLHNYGAFEISTIDAFMHRLIRTFARDLKLPYNFEVELNQELLLSEAVDKLLTKLGSDELITSTLVDFAIEKSKEDKSWDITYDLNEVASLLLNEVDYNEIQKVKHKGLERFLRLKEILKNEYAEFSSKTETLAQNTIDLINELGLEPTDFARSSIPNYFKNLLLDHSKIRYGAAWQENLVNGETIYPSRVPEDKALTIEQFQPQLAETFLKSKVYYFQLQFLKSALKHLTPFSVLNLINSELNELKKDKNILLISEFNSIIQNEIRNQPTPFIYERLGERFKHFFIDEFQDTSKLQWKNLIPLLDNSLSEGKGEVMIVGDAKQSIYRWRGGEPEQFMALCSGENQPFHVEPSLLSLGTNYRSAKAIVSFNNDFFGFLADIFFNNSSHQMLYSKSQQKISLDIDGYVKLKFLEISSSSAGEELYLRETLDNIKQCLENGYNYRDICILTRKRKEGVALAEFLGENAVPVTSSETLLLKNSVKVNFVNTILQLLLQPKNQLLRAAALDYLAHREGIEDKHSYYLNHINLSLDEFLSAISTSKARVKSLSILQKGLYELVEYIVASFDLNHSSDAYLQYFLDEVFEFSQTQEPDISKFLDYFEDNENRLSIVVSNNIDAVKLVTIHKSKGLEYPVVIFPFADVDIYKELKPKIWFPIESDKYNGFHSLLVDFNSKVEHYRAPGNEIYTNRIQELELDGINLLYVALTRASEQLIVIGKMQSQNSKNSRPRTFSEFLLAYLKSKGLWEESKDTYNFGNPVIKGTTHLRLNNEVIELRTDYNLINKLRITTNAALLWNYNSIDSVERGNLIHKILADVRYASDIDYALNLAVSSGEVEHSKNEELKELINEVVKHPKISPFFDGTYTILNEQDIITPNGELIRPDRIAIKNKTQLSIIDYKTGRKSDAHAEQLFYYGNVLQDMNYEIKNRLLVYINDAVEISEV